MGNLNDDGVVDVVAQKLMINALKNNSKSDTILEQIAKLLTITRARIPTFTI